MEVDINMVFQILAEFMLPVAEAAQLDLGTERVDFQKPEKLGQHMKPLYIKGFLDGEPINRMLVDGGACVIIMPHEVFEKLGHHESELMRTNMTLNGFSGEASEAKGIISKELTVDSKTMPTAFFVVDVKGKDNVLLGRDWIHTNGCVPSTLHQCVVQ
jgi:predicted aspartyl protease